MKYNLNPTIATKLRARFIQAGWRETECLATLSFIKRPKDYGQSPVLEPFLAQVGYDWQAQEWKGSGNLEALAEAICILEEVASMTKGA